MAGKTFVPFNQLEDRQAIIVDSIHPRGVEYSHWKGARVPDQIRDDTSAGIVINAIIKSHPGINIPIISSNHFDIDGFVGVWSLFNPNLAMHEEYILRESAVIGDFRECNLKYFYSNEALKLVCWINTVEKREFYGPFEEQDEVTACAEKFDYFLPRFKEVLQDVEQFKQDWEEEYNLVHEHYDIIHQHSHCYGLKDIGLMVVETPNPLHYYALFSESSDYDMVLTIYGDRRYELEYKYSTWIDLSSRPTFPRVDMTDLVKRLNDLEISGKKWTADKITDTGPILRLEDTPITKAERFDHPFRRTIHSSSIDPEIFKQMVSDFFRERYKNVEPKKYWTWDEIREMNLAMTMGQ